MVYILKVSASGKGSKLLDENPPFSYIKLAKIAGPDVY